jgi:O-antigen ligase
LSSLKWPAFFGTVLALYASVTVSRLHEVIPFLGRLYVGKTLAPLLLVAAFTQLQGPDWSRGLKTKVAKCVGIITLLAFLSVPTSVWPRESVSFFRDQWSQTMLLFACVAVGFANRRTAYVSVAAVCFTAVLAALEMVVGVGASGGGRSFIASDLSLTYDANASAALFAAILPYLVMFATRRGKLRSVAIAAIPVVIIAIVKTVSRGGIIALGVCAIALLAVAPKSQRKYYVALLAVMVLTIIVTPHQGLVERFSDLSGSQDYNFNARDGRLEVWKRGIVMMLTHPFLGIGVSAYMYANANAAHSWVNAHNALVQIGAELGIGGLVAFVAALVAGIRGSLLLRRKTAPTATGYRTPADEFDHAFATAAVCSLITTIAAAMFLSMAYDALMMFALAVPAALSIGTAHVPARVTGARTAAPVSNGPGGAPLPGWRSGRRVLPPGPVVQRRPGRT